MHISERLAEFVEGTSFRNLPQTTHDLAKKAVLDFLGVSVAGSTSDWSKIVLGVVRSGGASHATVIGEAEKTSVFNAALANGTMAHSHDFDDVHNASATHPGSAVISAALACAEKEGTDGETFIAAIVLGYDAMIRLSLALNPESHYRRGFHPTATCGTFGAAVTASKILSLESEKIANALGIAGSFAAGLLEFLADGAMTKRLHPGKAAQNGLLSAYLARDGFTGPKSVFEGRDGVLHAYSDASNAELLLSDLGSSFKILEDSFKPYACCRCSHSAIDALFSIMKKTGVNAESISAMDAKTPSWAARLVSEPSERKYHPETMLEAQMSLPYSLAVAAYRGTALLNEFQGENLRDPKILNLARRVQAARDEGLDEACKSRPDTIPAVVEVRTIEGKVYVERVDYAKGDPQNPMNSEEHHAKFKSLMAHRFDEKTTEMIADTVDRLEKLQRIEELASLLRMASR
ncbi:MAG: MmgE/PrpD family protein [Candidatus Bathyarchaeia archaeon]